VKLFLSISIALLFLIPACTPPPNLTHTNCTVPLPECRPGKSSARGIDTSTLQPGYFKYHIDLLPAQINSNNNENAIAFIKNGGNEIALLSAERKSDDEKKQMIFSSKLMNDLHFDQLKAISGTQDYENIGIADYCQADQKLYFTAKAKNDDPNDYDIFSAKIKDVITIESITSLAPINKLNNFDGQPAVSNDGLMIVFASDRAGGHGGVDLWYSTRTSTNSEWEEPKVLPSEINTPCDELSPSFSADGKKLYFSSNGHDVVGGYDIFSTEFKNGSWTDAENIGSPINTQYDENFPYQLSDSQFFYTSDQPTSFNGRNIFVLRRTYLPPKDIASKSPEKIPEKIPEKTPERKLPENQIPDTIQLKGKVEMPTDHDTTLPEVFVRDVKKDKEIARKKTDSAGDYSFRVEKGREYDVGSDRKDKFYDVHRVDARNPRDSIIIVPPLVIPDTLVLRINFPFDDYLHPYDFVIDENGHKTDTRWQTSIDLVAKSIKNSSSTLQSVILYGHTDSLGTDEYNFNLAKRRAQFVAKELEKRGIPPKLLVIFPKGRTMPVTRGIGESDEIFYLRCRRVEFVKFFTTVKK
jgi:hypothetical protein